MNKSIIHYGLILDKSGSMNCLKQIVISCFNEQISAILKMQEDNPGSRIRVTFCTFNDEISFPYLFASPDTMKELTEDIYQPASFTALYDAIGMTVSKMVPVVNDRVYLAIFTDGLENASKEYKQGQIRQMLHDLRFKGWNIQFFCSEETKMHHQQSLGLDDKDMLCLRLNDSGIRYMSDKIKGSLEDIIRKGK